METIGANEAERQFSEILDRASRGEQFCIVKDGLPLAMLQPMQTESGGRRSVEETIEALMQFREGNRLDGVAVRELLEEGRD